MVEFCFKATLLVSSKKFRLPTRVSYGTSNSVWTASGVPRRNCERNLLWRNFRSKSDAQELYTFGCYRADKMSPTIHTICCCVCKSNEHRQQQRHQREDKNRMSLLATESQLTISDFVFSLKIFISNSSSNNNVLLLVPPQKWSTR